MLLWVLNLGFAASELSGPPAIVSVGGDNDVEDREEVCIVVTNAGTGP